VAEEQRSVLPEAGIGVQGRNETVPAARLVADEVEAQGVIEVQDAPPEGWERAVIVVADDTAAELAAPVVGLVWSQVGRVAPSGRVAPVVLAAELV
jgi:hypothetical protein